MKDKQRQKQRKPADLRLILSADLADTLRARAEQERRNLQAQALLEIEWALTHRTSEPAV